MDFRLVSKGKVVVDFEKDGIMCFFTLLQWEEFREMLRGSGVKMTIKEQADQ